MLSGWLEHIPTRGELIQQDMEPASLLGRQIAD